MNCDQTDRDRKERIHEREQRKEYVKKRRSKLIENTEFPQERHFRDMENKPKIDKFDLLSLQRNMRCELGDDRVKLTTGNKKGRVNLEVKEDVLTNILDALKGKKTWSHDKELMEKEICALKDQLNKGPSDINPKTKDMKSQIQMLCKKLSLTLDDLDVEKSHNKVLEKTLKELPVMKTEEVIKYLESQHGHHGHNKDLKEQICKTKDVQDKLEKVEAEKKDLMQQLDSHRSEWQAQHEKHQKETRMIVSALRKAELLLETERFCWQQEKSSMLEEMEKSRALLAAQLDQQKHENNTLVAALNDLKQQLDSHRSEWQEEKTLLIQATEEHKKVLEVLERCRASQQAQHQKHEQETMKISTALKKAEDLLQTERLCWQQEKSSLLEEMEKSRALHETQPDEQKHENDTLVAALRNTEQELQGHQVEWQEENTSLVQASEDLKKTLQDTEEAESALKSQLEDLTSKQKKKKKWFRKFF